MKSWILSFLNAPIFGILVLLAIVIQTSLFNAYPLNYLQPDLVLICVIWCALQRSFAEGGILTLIFAQMAEIHSSAPQGLFLVAYMTEFLVVRALAKLLVLGRLATWIQLVLFASVLWKMIALIFVGFMGLAGNQWRHTLVLLMPGAVMNGVVAIWIFRWLYQMDRATTKSPKLASLFDPSEEEVV
jgi:hypothetical protein